MGGNRKIAKNLKTCIAVVLVLLMCAGAVFCQQRTTFDNPLDEMANSMLMLSAEGKALIEEQEIQKPPEDVEEPEPEEEEKPPEEYFLAKLLMLPCETPATFDSSAME